MSAASPEQTLPLSPMERLREFVDNLGPGTIEGASEQMLLRLNLEYGHTPSLAAEYSREKIIEAVGALMPQLAEFVRIGQEPTLPTYIHDSMRENEWAPFFTELSDTNSWLGVLANTDPVFTSNIASQVAATITSNYSRGAFAGVLTSMSGDFNQTRHHTERYAQALAGSTVATLAAHSQDPTALRAFARSEFFADFGSMDNSGLLFGRIVELEGAWRDGKWTNDCMQLLKSLRQSLAKSGGSMFNHAALTGVIQHSPEFIPGIADDFPDARTLLFRTATETILSKEASKRTLKEIELIHHIETASQEDLFDYLEFISAAKKAGATITAEQAARLARLVALPKGTFEEYFSKTKERAGWLYYEDLENVLTHAHELVAKYLPADLLPEAISEDPSLVKDARPKELIIRRLAASGNVTLAMSLADKPSTTLDSRLLRAEPIINLLAIYEESGDAAALEAANAKIATFAADQLTGDRYSMHDFELQKYIAASQHNNYDLLLASINAIRPHHETGEEWEVETALRQSLKMFLAAGYLKSAQEVALLMREKLQNSSDAYANERSYDGVVKVVRAYTDAGDMNAAAALVMDVLLRDRPISLQSVPAIQYILAAGA